jgi:hypothetical protein
MQVNVIVSSNFEKRVKTDKRDVLLYSYVPWDKNYENDIKELEILAKNLGDK